MWFLQTNVVVGATWFLELFLDVGAPGDTVPIPVGTREDVTETAAADIDRGVELLDEEGICDEIARIHDLVRIHRPIHNRLTIRQIRF
jgi:hypothetical protein